jgi:dolichol-phosphate mannosyltransferase
MYLSVIVAAYNEQENIEELTIRLERALKKLQLPFEIIYIIDGEDSTADRARKLAKKFHNISVDSSKKKRGFRNSFIKGLSIINKKCTHILTLDADLNHRPEEIPDLISCMNHNHVDIVIGSRYIGKGKILKLPLWKRFISKLANTIMNIFWKLDVKDKTSGFRLYRREVLENCATYTTSPNFEFLFELLIIAKKAAYTIAEKPILFKARAHGESKFELWNVIKGYIKIMLKYA